MKDQIYEKLIDYLGKVENFASNEIPIFIREVAFYGIVSNILIFFILFTISFILYKVHSSLDKDRDEIIKKYNEQIEILVKKKGFVTYSEQNQLSNGDDEIAAVRFSIVSSIVLFLISIIPLFFSIKAFICPKLYVIERFIR